MSYRYSIMVIENLGDCEPEFIEVCGQSLPATLAKLHTKKRQLSRLIDRWQLDYAVKKACKLAEYDGKNPPPGCVKVFNHGFEVRLSRMPGMFASLSQTVTVDLRS